MIPRNVIQQRGLTIIEVLVALIILSVVLLPIVLGFSQALIATSNSSITSAASSIAREKAEELKSKQFEELDTQPREPRDLNPGDGFFEVAVTIETVRPDDAAHSGLKKADVSVYRAGGSDPVAGITTYFTPYGI